MAETKKETIPANKIADNTTIKKSRIRYYSPETQTWEFAEVPDMNYQPASINAQSGIAVASALTEEETKRNAALAELNDELTAKIETETTARKNVDSAIINNTTLIKNSDNNFFAGNNYQILDAQGNIPFERLKDTVDQTYNPKSEHPQSGKAVAQAITTATIAVDDVLDENSVNPVQNKVVTKEFKKIEDLIGVAAEKIGLPSNEGGPTV